MSAEDERPPALGNEKLPIFERERERYRSSGDWAQGENKVDRYD